MMAESYCDELSQLERYYFARL